MSFASRFRTPEGAQKFQAAYQAIMDLWPVPYDVCEVETHFGTTHVKITGSPDAPPLVLIHGGQIGSPIWYPNIEPLSRHFRVFAPDVVDQMGLSKPTRKLKTADDCAVWLAETLDGLKIEKAIIAGHSHGGWQTLNMAIHHPARVTRMILLSPAASFVRFSFSLFTNMLPVLIRPTRYRFYRSFQWTTTLPLNEKQPNPIVELFMIGALNFKPEELSLGVVGKFREAELRQVDIPTLLLTAENEVIYSMKPQRLIEHARRVMPHIQAELIPDGKHLFPVSHAEITNERMLAFLTR